MIDQFVYCINSYREAAVSSDPKFDHIDLAEKQKVCMGVLDLTICLFIIICSPILFLRMWFDAYVSLAIPRS